MSDHVLHYGEAEDGTEFLVTTFDDGTRTLATKKPVMSMWSPAMLIIDLGDTEQIETLAKSIVEAAFRHGNTVVSDQGIHPDTVAEALRSMLAKDVISEVTC